MLPRSRSLLRPSRTARSSLALPRRYYQSQESRPTPQGQFIQDQFVTSAGVAINLFTRFVKFSLLGGLGLGFTAWTIFEGTHLWVESVELASDQDDETRRWEWHQDAERWTGGEHGGTDPALGFRARHLLRGSWMAENWGIGSTTFSDNGGIGGRNAVEARLDFAQNYLDTTIKIAETRITSAKLRPQTINELFLRHGAILERIGTKEALFEARSKYERIWAGLPGKGPDAARIAVKLGDLNFRLGDSNDALAWWTRSLSLSQGTQQTEGAVIPTISQSAPSSPSAQRTLTTALVSLSAYYSTSGQLQQARQLQETALEVLRSIPSSPNISSASPPQMLHSLYLLHRSSLISIHLAEVLYALRSPQKSSFDYLTRAAESSERVALALTGLPFNPPHAEGSGVHTPAPDATILPLFAKSHAMQKPATGLLRDARRTAAGGVELDGNSLRARR
ncbi:hypothetical protein JVT61DRAFT_2115 [Boletus reticuloceps]|uniref:Uncharacterized protein n=1 Tax=Boletus reticuloceps TaxID=495285 RepID=A0A8I3A8T6_9AGAM|nr:hypothetical protein JVT61DRAFT_2115 [Boletus reticuloceps]